MVSLEARSNTKILTFNPSWNSSAENVDPLEDICDLQAHLEHKGIDVDARKVASNSSGWGHFIFLIPMVASYW